jgi:predicted enzyme related to lactoylglutathione lyase
MLGETAKETTAMPNPVVHFEITGRDGRKLQDFYSQVFGWQLNADNPMNYGLVDNGGEGINGGISAGDQPHAMFYIAVSDPDEYLPKIEAMGGRVAHPTEVITGMVTFAHFTDPEGNLVGLVKDEPIPGA